MFGWLAVTWLLGAGFMVMEIWEFNHLVQHGHGPDHSAFLSAFFALVGTTACTSAAACCGCW
jgi:cytochrome o ubiquinol oxidase subunit 3